jgi:hypothetical protein
MFWYSLHQLIAFLLDILRVVWQPLDQKDLDGNPIPASTTRRRPPSTEARTDSLASRNFCLLAS